MNRIKVGHGPLPVNNKSIFNKNLAKKKARNDKLTRTITEIVVEEKLKAQQDLVKEIQKGYDKVETKQENQYAIVSSEGIAYKLDQRSGKIWLVLPDGTQRFIGPKVGKKIE